MSQNFRDARLDKPGSSTKACVILVLSEIRIITIFVIKFSTL